MSGFELLLFCVDPNLAVAAVDAGIHGIIIDWEYRGKHRRQRDADTQVNHHTPADLGRIRSVTAAPVIVRLNRFSQRTARELELAIDGGADELLLPMVESPGQVERLLALARRRIAVGILVETLAAIDCAADLGRFPLCRVYVGLNDLAIQRRTESIFAPLIDGTLDRIRPAFNCPFGFAGLTLPDGGHPIPCRLIIGELMRRGASFSFLRRSFQADIAGRDLRVEIPRLQMALGAAHLRPPAAVDRDHRALAAAISGQIGIRFRGDPSSKPAGASIMRCAASAPGAPANVEREARSLAGALAAPPPEDPVHVP